MNNQNNNQNALVLQFLDKYECKANGKEDEQKTQTKIVKTHTHLSNVNYLRRCLQIPDDDKIIQEFYKDYVNLINKGVSLGLTEKHQDVSPIIIDLDFRSVNKPGTINVLKQEYHEEYKQENGIAEDEEYNPEDDETVITEENEHKYDTIEKNHLYTKYFIHQFIDDYLNVISQVANIPQPVVKVFIMEKSQYTYKEDQTGNITYKDGVHIVIPEIVLENSFALYIRKLYLEKTNFLSQVEYKSLNLKESLHQCFDESVIERNNWFLYGSGKPDCEVYKCSQIVEMKTTFPKNYETMTNMNYIASNREDVQNLKKYTFEYLVQHLSIRWKADKFPLTTKKYHISQLEIEKQVNIQDIINYKQLQQQGGIGLLDIQASDRDQPLDCMEGYKYVRQIVLNVLNPKRADDYTQWLQLGWCLFNIASTKTSKDKERLLQLWIQFSQKCSGKYKSGECEKLWNKKFVVSRMGIPTLKMWARQDDYDKFQDINKDSIFKHIDNATVNSTDTNIMQAMYSCYGDIFVCANQKNKEWYYFNEHRWHKTDGGYMLKWFMSNDFWQKFCQYENILTQKEQGICEKMKTTKSHKIADKYNILRQTKRSYDDENEDSEDDDDDQNSYTSFLEKQTISYHDQIEKIMNKKQEIHKIKIALQTASKKINFLTEACEIFYRPGFQENLDQNKYLMAFTNGVYDFKNNIFRDGNPDDFISKCTKIPYEPFNPNSQQYIEISQYLSQVFVNSRIRKYTVQVLASCLCNHGQEQAMFFLYGNGSNSKSMLMNLIQSCFGDYYVTFEKNILVDTSTRANAASPSLYNLKGARIAVAHELREQEIINASTFKSLSGGDKITARNLFKNTEEFEPICRIMATTNNYVPFSENEYAVYRRLKVIPFLSKFVKYEDKNPKNKYEHVMDTNLKDKMESWPIQFMAYLIETFKTLNKKSVQQPEEITAEVEKYRASQDVMYQFYDSVIKIVPTTEPPVMHRDLWVAFRTWVKDNKSEDILKTYRSDKLQRFMREQLMINEEMIGKTKKFQAYPGIAIKDDEEQKQEASTAFQKDQQVKKRQEEINEEANNKQ